MTQDRQYFQSFQQTITVSVFLLIFTILVVTKNLTMLFIGTFCLTLIMVNNLNFISYMGWKIGEQEMVGIIISMGF